MYFVELIEKNRVTVQIEDTIRILIKQFVELNISREISKFPDSYASDVTKIVEETIYKNNRKF